MGFLFVCWECEAVGSAVGGGGDRRGERGQHTGYLKTGSDKVAMGI